MCRGFLLSACVLDTAATVAGGAAAQEEGAAGAGVKGVDCETSLITRHVTLQAQAQLQAHTHEAVTAASDGSRYYLCCLEFKICTALMKMPLKMHWRVGTRYGQGLPYCWILPSNNSSHDALLMCVVLPGRISGVRPRCWRTASARPNMHGRHTWRLWHLRWQRGKHVHMP